jgi:hypothetical protein
MHYGISPSLVDVAPAVLRWFYEHASPGSHWDYLVAGPSGSGYTYPSRWPPDRLDAYLQRLNQFMGAADLRVCQILDFHLDRVDLWSKNLAPVDQVIHGLNANVHVVTANTFVKLITKYLSENRGSGAR